MESRQASTNMAAIIDTCCDQQSDRKVFEESKVQILAFVKIT